MRPNIPSLMSLLAFEAASRHLSFTLAGKELNLTQTAISHQIKRLEERLDADLFVRRSSGLQLTAAGHDYLEAVREAINLLHTATSRTQHEHTVELLTISCLPTYATRCLIPALPDFQSKYPHITLQVLTSKDFDLFKQRSYDVAIRYGSGQWPGVRADLLTEEEIFPVCTPTMASESGLTLDREALYKLTQIRTYFFSSSYADDWPKWLEFAGMPARSCSREAIFNVQLTALQAAVEGMGIALGRTPLVDSFIRNGALVAPLDLRMKTGSGYYLVSSEERSEDYKVVAFRQWAAVHLRT